MRLGMLFLTFGCAALAACGSDTDVLATQFDQSCSSATDCVAVEELTVHGSMCTHHCPTSAVNIKAKSAFDAAKNKAASGCTSSAMPGCVVSGPVVCQAGRCTMGVDASQEIYDVSGD